MAKKPLFSLEELIPKGVGKDVITANATTNKLLTIRARKVSTSEFSAALQRAVNRASERITADLKQALDAAMRSNVWSTPGGSGDIYDTGELMASGSVSVTSSGVIISYDAPYAALVHYGGYISAYGNDAIRVYLPPRPWIDAVLTGRGPVPAFDFTSYYLREIEAEFS